MRERFGVRCMLGLTATATMVTAASVAKHLGVVDYQSGTIRGSPVPSNLCLSVSRDEDRDEVNKQLYLSQNALVSYINELLDSFNVIDSLTSI